MPESQIHRWLTYSQEVPPFCTCSPLRSGEEEDLHPSQLTESRAGLLAPRAWPSRF